MEVFLRDSFDERERFSASLKSLSVLEARRRILNLSCTCCTISPWMNNFIYGLHSKSWGHKRL